MAVMHGNLPAGLAECQRNLAAQAFGGTGDEHGSGAGVWFGF